jgi:hypothetical protein
MFLLIPHPHYPIKKCESSLPLTLLLVRSAAEKRPGYARDLAFTLFNAGHREDAARLWVISEATAPDGSCRYDEKSDTYTILGFGMDIQGQRALLGKLG